MENLYMVHICIAVICALVTLHAFMYVACWCAMATRFRLTGYDSNRHIRIMTWHLIVVMYINSMRHSSDQQSDYDILVEMIAAFYIFGYTAGKFSQPESGLEPYVRRHAVTKPYHKQLLRLTRSAYRIGQEDLRCTNAA